MKPGSIIEIGRGARRQVIGQPRAVAATPGSPTACQDPATTCLNPRYSYHLPGVPGAARNNLRSEQAMNSEQARKHKGQTVVINDWPSMERPRLQCWVVRVSKLDGSFSPQLGPFATEAEAETAKEAS